LSEAVFAFPICLLYIVFTLSITCNETAQV